MQSLKLAGNRATSAASTPRNSTRISPSSMQARPPTASATAAPAAPAAPAAARPPLLPSPTDSSSRSTAPPSSSRRSSLLLAAAAAAAAANVALALSPVPPAALAAGVPDPGCSLATAGRTKIQFCDSVVGGGAVPSPSARVRAHYTGRLSPSGAVFDSSYERRRPLEFKKDQVIKGWGLGVWGDGEGGEIPPMHEGGKRRLVIPPELGYGDRGAGGVIPGGATLVFDVELLGPRKAG